MSTKKYYQYSNEEVRFVEVYKNETDKYLKNYPLFIIGFVSCLLLIFSYSIYFPTPRELTLLKKNQALNEAFQSLNQELENLDHEIMQISQKDDSLYRMILGVDPVSPTIRKAGIGGIPMKELQLNEELGELPNVIHHKLNKLFPRAGVLSLSLDKTMDFARKNFENLKHIPAIMPVYNKDLQRTGAGFGMRLHPILGIRRMHEGLDFYATIGTKVFATADGTVKSKHYSTTFGNLVVLDHGNGLETYYAHLSKFSVKKGQKVKRGDVIAMVGNTGLSSGPHLHYEIHKNNKEVNPINYLFSDLTAEQYQQVVKISQQDAYSMD